MQHGSRHRRRANVTDIAVHCANAATPGLDPTFGTDGRVSTPVGGGGQGEAVVIQPDGGIVTAGWRSVAPPPAGLRAHPARRDGSLDARFGTDGIATTDLGGADDEAYDAARCPTAGSSRSAAPTPPGS